MTALTPTEKKPNQPNCLSKRKASVVTKKDCMVQIPINIPLELLNLVEQNVEGLSRSEKLRKCIQQGYEKLTKKKPAKRGRVNSHTLPNLL